MRLTPLITTVNLCVVLALGASTPAMAREKAAQGADEADADGEEVAAQWEESDDLPAVQNRLYRTEIEINGGIGVLPIDPYVKGVSFNGGLAWHFNDIWALDGRFHYLLNLSTSLRDKLENQFGIPPTRFAEIEMYGTLGGLFKPIYGKLAFLNQKLVYGELYLSLAGAVAMMNGGRKTDNDPDGKGRRLAFGGAPGFGIRGYFFTWLSVRLDFRWLLLYSQGEGHYPLALSLAFGLTTRSDL